MNRKEKENEIFELWRCRHPDKTIIPDGIVCEEIYNSSKIKILFLLKEVNYEGKDEWDLRSFLYKGGRPLTWRPAARWLKGIFSLPQKMSFEHTAKICNEERAELLQHIVCINLKKYGGGARTIKKTLQAFARKGKDLLNMQFGLYKDADYVICCGPDVMNLAKELITFIYDADRWQTLTETNVSYLEFAPQKYVIGFFHPQQRTYKHKDIYEKLINTIAVLEERKKQ